MNDLTIYHKKILELASANRKSFEINDFNFSKEIKNPLCGDLVEVRINIINNSIKNLSAKVKGCALCEASAGVVVNYFLNKNLPTYDFMEYFDKWLAKEYDEYPDELPEENIYNKAHLLIYLFYIISIGSVVWLLLNQN